MSGKNFKILFVRHAESLGNTGLTEYPPFHRDDPPLSENGLIQAKKLADSFDVGDITKLYSSTLIRAIQTAYPVAEKLNLPLYLLHSVMEENTFTAGTDITYIKEKYPLAKYADEAVCSGEETAEQEAARAERALDLIFSQAEENEKIMVVSHGSFFGYLLRGCLGISLPEPFRWQVDNCSVTGILFEKGRIPKLCYANSTAHLSERE